MRTSDRYYIGVVDGHMVGVHGSLYDASNSDDYPFNWPMNSADFNEVEEEEYDNTVLDCRYELDRYTDTFCWRQ